MIRQVTEVVTNMLSLPYKMPAICHIHPKFNSSAVKPSNLTLYSKTCLKRNAIIPVFFPFSQISVLQRVVF
jgi:hypothetical protein